jgi:hypothetical protein
MREWTAKGAIHHWGMRGTTIAALCVAAVGLIAGLTAAGYVLGETGAPDSDDAERERQEARLSALAEGQPSADRELERIRRRGVAQGQRSGRKSGARKGREAGEAAAAARGAGPTVVPAPKLPTDITTPDLAATSLIDQPSEMIVGNHSVLEAITWTTWGGEVAEGSATLVGVDCNPSCAEGPEVRYSVGLKAWQPSFTPDNVRYYSKLTVEGADVPRNTIEISAY